MQIDWKHPEPYYQWVWQQRCARLARIRAEPNCLPALRQYYKYNPWDFIEDWGVTLDPRNAEVDRPVLMPFVLMPKQREWLQWVWTAWREKKLNGLNASHILSPKSRDMGLSWCAIGLSCAIGLFWDDVVIGFGSRKKEYVDDPKPKSLFFKGRAFVRNVPVEFRPGWDERKHSPQMRIEFPHTRSFLGGECGDSIGRGDRCSIYFVDEAAHLEHPEDTDSALSATTNCRVDITSVNGLANPFAQKVHGGKHPVFIFHWRDDPRRDQQWADETRAAKGERVWAQEFEIDYAASAVGVVIPSLWVAAAVDAHKRLPQLNWTGRKYGSMDVGDTGDRCAGVYGDGNILRYAESWSGAASNTYKSVQYMFRFCERVGIDAFNYDGDGLGALVRGDAENINQVRRENRTGYPIEVWAFRGSASGDNLWEPDRIVPGTGTGQGVEGNPQRGRTARDYFANCKAQGWWMLRYRFENTWKALQGMEYDPEWMISIEHGFAELEQLKMELCQPVYYEDGAGRIVIDKTPEGVKSPNLGDGTMMRFMPRRFPMKIAGSLVPLPQAAPTAFSSGDPELPAHWR
jgi:phage terminase large subunit